VARTDNKPVVVGRISGLFGVRGWVKIHSYTEPREAILDYRDWMIETGGEWRPIAATEAKPHGKTIVAHLDGVDDRDAAAEYVQATIGIDRSQLPETADGEFYWSDLEGLTVERKDGEVLGTVAYLLETGANDVLVVRDGDRETLIPFVMGQVVKDVDLAGGVIRVDWDWA
jgi:16S rRNA processing protein RimM